MLYKTKADLIKRLISKSDVVLDIGFSGQGIQEGNDSWPHALLRQQAKEVYGVDINLPSTFIADSHYQEASAENFSFPLLFDVIFAGDLIEHLSNPGLFIERCKKHLAPDGRIILTTPNAFNLFNIAEKFTKNEPTVNSDHTFYFNSKTLKVLLSKNGVNVEEYGHLYTLGYDYHESWKKKILNGCYWLVSKFTDKFIETLVVIAKIPA